MREFTLGPGGACLPMVAVDEFGHEMPDLGANSELVNAQTEAYSTGEPVIIHVEPGRYDECVSLRAIGNHDTMLQSWTADTPIQFIEPAPWYVSALPLACALTFSCLLMVLLGWLWGRQEMEA